MSSSIQYASFLIRLWRETRPGSTEPPADLCGEVEHIQTGACWTFDTLDEMLDFLRRGAQDPQVIQPGDADQDCAEGERPA